MSDLAILNQKGEEAGKYTVEIPKDWKKRTALLWEAVYAGQSSRRQVLANTKHRGEVAGGGIKPWRQKGTGRARVGSIRSPLWRGGGVVFGPRKNRNFGKHLTKNARRQAFGNVLIQKIVDKKLYIIQKIELSKPSTKGLLEILGRLNVLGKVLIIGESDPILEKSAANIIFAKFITLAKFNIIDLINFDNLLITQPVWDRIAGLYLESFSIKSVKKSKGKE